MPECDWYTPWYDHGVMINECLEFYQGICHEPLSAYADQPCPWAGYPCAPRCDHPAPLETKWPEVDEGWP